jgi:hypothetical protein
VSGAGDWNGDGKADILIGADRQSGSGGGAAVGVTYLMAGPVTGTWDLGLGADVIFEGEADQDRSGSALDSLGDINDDGFDDILIGAFGEDSGGASAGAAYVLLGPRAGTVSLSSAEAKITGEIGGDYAGYSVASAGDVNADGVPDLIIGAYGQDAGGVEAGATYLLLGPITADIDLSFADTKFIGEGDGDKSGWDVDGAGDVDGDGFDDLIIGAPTLVSDEAHLGGAYLLFGDFDDSTMSLSEAPILLLGEQVGDLAGHAVAGVGDVDGDGYDDLLIGAPEEDTNGALAGAVYLVSGTSSITPGTWSLSIATAKIMGEGNDDYLGSDVNAAGDLDQDGNADILVGARLDDDLASNAGAAYIFLGPVSGTFTAIDTDGKIIGSALDDWTGSAVAPTGDVDGDGFDDVLIGSPNADDGDVNAGAARLILGGGF